MRWLIAVLLADCTPTIPLATLETAETLEARTVTVSAAGGAGGGNGGICCGGGMARVRVGIGGRQELGADVAVLDDGNSADVGAKLAYKHGLTSNLAILAGAGGTHGSVYGNSAGVDAAFVASTGSAVLQYYGSLRVSLAVPVREDLYSDGGLAQVGSLALGITHSIGMPIRLFAEVGGIGATSERYDFIDTSKKGTYTSEGFYLAGGLTYAFGKN